MAPNSSANVFRLRLSLKDYLGGLRSPCLKIRQPRTRAISSSASTLKGWAFTNVVYSFTESVGFHFNARCYVSNVLCIQKWDNSDGLYWLATGWPNHWMTKVLILSYCGHSLRNT
ncbi:Uncharacterized protein HZ326_27195 [Fusarium oxysporum f. sp. albedinis]|nr:Uncharacterized protein HZ326_27195 [Fusarium oxysporum f. sp. albedinis]